jgi:2-methylcitrate dehydratase PrpD
MQSAEKSTLVLSNFVSTLSFAQIPPDAVEKARICLLDYLGSTYMGSRSREAVLLRKYIQKIGGQPQATLIGMKGCNS